MTHESSDDSGFGLGLSIVRRGAKLLNVSVRIKTQAGKGSGVGLYFDSAKKFQFGFASSLEKI